ncbi:MAG: YhgE/Pip family protein [Peptostreptococcaceae bacterium]
MNGIELFLKEFKNIFKNKKILVQLVAILFVPVLYSGMFLWAFWDPYNKMDKLPVAVINMDKGAEFNNKKINVGKDLVDNLKKNDTFNWKFVNDKDGIEGLENQEYYMAVRIPENFSEKATTLLDKNPSKLNLEYIPNESYNFLSSQIGETAVLKIKDEVSSNLSETYAKTMFDSVKEMANGIKDASDGADAINNGTVDAKNGSIKLRDNLQTLAKSSITFEQGMSTAYSGSKDLNSGLKTLNSASEQLTNGGQTILSGTKGLQDGANKLNAGIQTSKDGANQLYSGLQSSKDGANQLYSGLQTSKDGSNQLYSGIKTSKDGIDSINGNMGTLVDGSNKINTGLGSLSSGASQLSKGADNLSSGANNVYGGIVQLRNELNGVLALLPEDQKQKYSQTINQLSGSLDQLVAGSKQVADGAANISSKSSQLSDGASNLATNMGSINKGLNQVAGGINQVSQGQGKLLDGSKALAQGQEQLLNGSKALAQGQDQLLNGSKALVQGQDQLLNGSKALVQGQDQLSTGVETMTGKMKEFNSGVKKVATGSESLTNGLSKLDDGAKSISSGSGQLAAGSKDLTSGLSKLNNGTSEMANSLKDASDKTSDVKTANDKNYKMFASPVDYKVEKVNPVPNYGTGFAPYFLSLGLFVGALILTIIFDLKTPIDKPKTIISTFISKLGIIVIVGTIQALIADALLIYGLGLDVKNTVYFVMLSILTSITFLTLIQMLVTWMGDVGRFVAIVILILQLTTSAGTFPLELIPDQLKAFNNLLPMTYSIKGFKAVISSGNFDFMWQNVNILLMYIGGMCLVSLLYFIVSYRKVKEKSVLAHHIK